MGSAASSATDRLDEFRQGSIDAFETLFRLHQRAVYGWILRMVRSLRPCFWLRWRATTWCGSTLWAS
jgi:hypothetical protein